MRQRRSSNKPQVKPRAFGELSRRRMLFFIYVLTINVNGRSHVERREKIVMCRKVRFLFFGKIIFSIQPWTSERREFLCKAIRGNNSKAKFNERRNRFDPFWINLNWLGKSRKFLEMIPLEGRDGGWSCESLRRREAFIYPWKVKNSSDKIVIWCQADSSTLQLLKSNFSSQKFRLIS